MTDDIRRHHRQHQMNNCQRNSDVGRWCLACWDSLRTSLWKPRRHHWSLERSFEKTEKEATFLVFFVANQGKIWKSTVVTQIYNFWFDIWEKSRFLQNICRKSTLHKWKGENWRFQQKDVFCQQDDFSKRSFTELCGKFNSLCKLWIHDSQVHKLSSSLTNGCDS